MHKSLTTVNSSDSFERSWFHLPVAFPPSSFRLWEELARSWSFRHCWVLAGYYAAGGGQRSVWKCSGRSPAKAVQSSAGYRVLPLDLWLFWFSNYKEMSGLDRQELVEKPAKWGGNRSTQITSVFMFSFDGKESFLVTLSTIVYSQPPPPVSPDQVIFRVPLGWGALPTSPMWVQAVNVHCQPPPPNSPLELSRHRVHRMIYLEERKI